MGMSVVEHRYLGTEAGMGNNLSQVNYSIDHLERRNVHGLRSLSPSPLLLAIIISFSMWTSIAGLIWMSVR
jgi:hypothetical protein